MVVARTKKPLDELTPSYQKQRKYFEENPEQLLKDKKRQAEYYKQNKPRLSKKKSETQRKRRLEAMSMLGSECGACGEKYEPNRKRINIEIHHLEYDERDKEKLKKYGTIADVVQDVLKMSEKGENPKKKYLLLCSDCNKLESLVRKNPDKAMSFLAWCIEQGIIDVETPNPEGNKRIDEFIRKTKN